MSILVPDYDRRREDISNSPDRAPVQALLSWYDRVKRELPWRKTSDPYRILVSEVMLQQTQVKTVLDYYERFLECFPDVHALAAADQERGLEVWKGLGYYRRARNLHACARRIVAEMGGRVPETFAELRRLPGVGDYTAAAVASIAFGQAKGVVDGNVLRVMARFLGIEEPIDDANTKRRIQEAVDGMICRDRPGDFNQALMELGATVCTPQRPRCDACPLSPGCVGRLQADVERLPVRRRKQQVSRSRRSVAVVERDGEVLLMKRPPDGLLGGMWEFLNLEQVSTRRGVQADQAAAKWQGERRARSSYDPAMGGVPRVVLEEVRSLTGTEALSWEFRGQVTHRFSHLEWEIDVFHVRLPGSGAQETSPKRGTLEVQENPPLPEILWVERESLHRYALPRVMQKVWETVVDGVAAG